MGFIFWTVTCAVVSLLIYLFKLALDTNKTFIKKGLPHMKPYPFIGNAWGILRRKENQGALMKRYCEAFPNEPMIGFYQFMKPMLILTDPYYIEKVMIKDFHHFVDRGFPIDEDTNPLDLNLFIMTGKKWKAMRNKLTPIFTTGKLKNMFPQIVNVGKNLDGAIEKEGKDCLALKDVLNCFAMDTIGSCAFGLEPTNLDDPDTEFVRMAKSVFEMKLSTFIRMMIMFNFPKIAKFFGFASFADRKAQNFFCGIIRETVDFRRKNSFKRNDFIELMMQLKEKGPIEVETKDPEDDYLNIDTSTTSSFEITDDVLIGQAFIFLTAGFETTSTTLNFLFYDLSKNPEIQEKARQDVLSCLEKNNGKLDYDSVKDMEYVEMCLNETMRIHSTISALGRMCTKEYTFPNGVTVEPGEGVFIPTTFIHMDPSNYPEPEKYDPERFAPGASRPPCSFLPFGDGPRICIAKRFAMLQMRFCVAKMLSEYRFKLNPKTEIPPSISPTSIFGTPAKPILFDLTKI